MQSKKTIAAANPSIVFINRYLSVITPWLTKEVKKPLESGYHAQRTWLFRPIHG
jgi:hypothetical protein